MPTPGARVKTRFNAQKVKKAAKRASITNLGHAGAAIRLVARHSIRKNPKRSRAGTPPHTRKGRLRNAIKYALAPDKQSVVIGPDYAVAADSGRAHEFGGRFRGDHYDRRPFMGPALMKVKDRLPAMWASSIK